MLTSTEIRRFQKGMIPHELLKTFEGSYPPEDRTDYYLDILTQDNLSIKVRGVDESRIEFKQRLEEGTSVSANGLTGTIESWSKWCFKTKWKMWNSELFLTEMTQIGLK